MEPTLQEKVKTVAEFMGLERVPVYTKGLPGNPDSLGWQDLKTLGPKTETALNYHTDYNRLMEVWVKFRKLVPPWFEVGHEMRCDSFVEALSNRSIETAFDCLYEAIVWYNSLNK